MTQPKVSRSLPLAEVAGASLQTTKFTPAPNYDQKVLLPIHQAQHKLAASCDAQGGSVHGVTCVLPPPPPPSPSPTPDSADTATTSPVAASVGFGGSVGSVGSVGSIQAIITSAALAHGVSPVTLLRVARCESTFNIHAYNPSGATGLFQYKPGTWAEYSAEAGYGGASIFDPVAQANVTAWAFAHGKQSAWVCQ